jgi:hypothetical protein
MVKCKATGARIGKVVTLRMRVEDVIQMMVCLECSVLGLGRKELIYVNVTVPSSRDNSVGIATRYGLDGPGI